MTHTCICPYAASTYLREHYDTWKHVLKKPSSSDIMDKIGPEAVGYFLALYALNVSVANPLSHNLYSHIEATRRNSLSVIARFAKSSILSMYVT